MVGRRLVAAVEPERVQRELGIVVGGAEGAIRFTSGGSIWMGIHIPEPKADGSARRLSTATAELGPAQYPTARPKAANGSVPATSVPQRESQVAAGSRTPPAVAPRVKRAPTMTSAKSTAIASLPVKSANGGIGVDRVHRGGCC